MAETVTPPTRPTAPGMKIADDFVKSLPLLGREPEKPAEATPPVVPPVDSTPPVETTPKPATEQERALPRNAKQWDEYKAADAKRLKEREEKIAELEKARVELAKQLESKPSPTKDLDDIRKERDDLSERLRIQAIENHPRFKQYFDGKVNNQIELAKKIVGNDNAERLSELLKLPESTYRQSQIDELVEALTPIQQSRIGGVLNSLAELEVEKSEQIQKAKSDFSRIQTEEQAKVAQQQKELETSREGLFNETLANETKSNFMFQKQEGKDDWNKEVDNRVAFAKNLLFAEKNPNTIAKAAFFASAFPAVVQSHLDANKRIEQLEQQVKDLTAATPRITGEHGEKGEKPARPKNKNYMGGMEQAGDWIAKINAATAESE